QEAPKSRTTSLGKRGASEALSQDSEDGSGYDSIEDTHNKKHTYPPGRRRGKSQEYSSGSDYDDGDGGGIGGYYSRIMRRPTYTDGGALVVGMPERDDED